MQGGIYRGEQVRNGLRFIKYQVARSAQDAMIRAAKFDDPCWQGIRFKFIERCQCPHEGMWQRLNQIVVRQ